MADSLRPKGSLFYCTHCLRGQEVIQTYYAELPLLVDHLIAHHSLRVIRRHDDWIFGDKELEEFWNDYHSSRLEIAGAFRRLALVETVDDFLELF
jgi:hypothetical protein